MVIHTYCFIVVNNSFYGYYSNNNNSKHICIVPCGHDFKGAGAKWLEKYPKERKPERSNKSLAWI